MRHLPQYFAFGSKLTLLLYNSGIKAYNDTVYNYAVFANEWLNGCLAQVELCRATNKTTLSEQSLCAEAGAMCRDNVEGVYYAYGERGVVSQLVTTFSSQVSPPYFAV